jgi:hypothetical protein
MNSNISRNLNSQYNSLKTKVLDRFVSEHLSEKKNVTNNRCKITKTMNNLSIGGSYGCH